MALMSKVQGLVSVFIIRCTYILFYTANVLFVWKFNQSAYPAEHFAIPYRSDRFFCHRNLHVEGLLLSVFLSTRTCFSLSEMMICRRSETLNTTIPSLLSLSTRLQHQYTYSVRHRNSWITKVMMVDIVFNIYLVVRQYYVNSDKFH